MLQKQSETTQNIIIESQMFPPGPPDPPNPPTRRNCKPGPPGPAHTNSMTEKNRIDRKVGSVLRTQLRQIALQPHLTCLCPLDLALQLLRSS